VLPVGGIKEKLLAAKSASATTLLLPSGCKRDFDELPEFIKTGIDVHFVDTYEEVLHPLAICCLCSQIFSSVFGARIDSNFILRFFTLNH
jgi:ATP-dependent Lon protease